MKIFLVVLAFSNGGPYIPDGYDPVEYANIVTCTQAFKEATEFFKLENHEEKRYVSCMIGGASMDANDAINARFEELVRLGLNK
ncbi:MAG: hypothetical protein QM498_06355 [Desulfobacterium sp.]